LLRELGYESLAFSSAEEFLASNKTADADCLILDVAMLGMSGPELQQELKLRQQNIPIIFITAVGGDPLKRVIEQGAVACLLKPFSDMALLRALEIALS